VQFHNVKLTALKEMGIELDIPAEIVFDPNTTATLRIKSFADRQHDVPIEGEVVRVHINTG
jgi:hypothetical protein